MKLRLRPITLREANKFVKAKHRHHGERQGHKFSISVYVGAQLVGVAICGNADARQLNPSDVQDVHTAEVYRVCTDGTYNACSMLYGNCARAAFAMGYDKIKTSILESESGASLKAAGWEYSHTTRGGTHDRPSRSRKRKPELEGPKKVFVKWKSKSERGATPGEPAQVKTEDTGTMIQAVLLLLC